MIKAVVDEIRFIKIKLGICRPGGGHRLHDRRAASTCYCDDLTLPLPKQTWLTPSRLKSLRKLNEIIMTLPNCRHAIERQAT